MQYESVIGLEIHVQLATNSKMFCRCVNKYNKQPNVNVCPVCLGLPGALPRTNRKAVEFATIMGLVTNCQIKPRSIFARKNYFYPDLPKSYQISQFEDPICQQGWVDIDIAGNTKKIGITRIHMEEDAGKLIHEGFDQSYVDLNRAGVPLIEIVSEPDLRTPEEAKAYMEKIYTLATYVGVCKGDMEEGNLRCDANISVRNLGENVLNTRTEIKNLNSFKFVQQAIEYEIARQIDSLADGVPIVQETRLFDSAAKKTFSMRKKEDAHDYRYFPCPDLPAVVFSESYVDEIRKNLPELPTVKKERFITEYELGDYDANLLTAQKVMADYFEKMVKLGANAKKSANWLLGDFSKLINETDITLKDSKVEPSQLVELISLVDGEQISGKIAKQVFADMFKTGMNAKKIVAQKGLAQISDVSQIESMASELVKKHTNEVEQYRAGRDRVLGFFVGQVMAQTKGKANPKVVNEILLKLLKK
ncbi:MAG: Asp-tRNA(Asn)/Glu-tRNA(Gln) amidotransferase subunit GatB [SAR324 cluster bacterium]|nr:Asp-tRNA(Asn)/Glu-tRNA(Gln) amidotransferase subunit GatB [SAR324 cluster bacterium]